MNPLARLTSDIFLREYQWERPFEERRDRDTRKTTLSVLLDEEASSRFSSLRMRLCCRAEEASKSILDPWNIIVESISSSAAPGDPVRTGHENRNDSVAAPLPELTIVFGIIPGQVIPSFNPPTRKSKKTTEFTSGKLVLAEPASVKDKPYVFFDEVQSLKPGSQTITTSFTHSALLRTSLNANETIPTSTRVICRVVHIFHIFPNSRSLSLPTELLLIIFGHLAGPSVYAGWRRDLLSCSLVCRSWSCASDLLLSDFVDGSSLTNPPDILALGERLRTNPSIGLAIRTIDTQWWEKRRYVYLSPSQRADSAKAFVHILHAARNTRKLSIAAHKIEPGQTESMVEALHDLRYLHHFRVYKAPSVNRRSDLSGPQLASCVAMWPSLKRLDIAGLSRGSASKAGAFVPLTCALDTLKLSSSTTTDGLLIYITSSSTSSLKHVVLSDLLGITNRGLRAFLASVSRSLQTLKIHNSKYDLGENEERVLDAVIVDMVRLKNLQIHGNVASTSMLERRAQAYNAQDKRQGNTSDTLSIVNLTIFRVPEILPAFDAGARWAGWNLKKQKKQRL